MEKRLIINDTKLNGIGENEKKKEKGRKKKRSLSRGLFNQVM